MRLSYHPATQRDVNDILDHYRQVSGDALAGRFYDELMERLIDVAAHPERFVFYLVISCSDAPGCIGSLMSCSASFAIAFA